MLTVSASTQAALSRTVTQPIVLVEIEFSTILRLSSSTTLTWDGYSWEGGRLMNGSVDLSPTKAGGRQGALLIANHDNAISALALSEGASGKACTIWYLYGGALYDEALKKLLFNDGSNGLILPIWNPSSMDVNSGSSEWAEGIKVFEGAIDGAQLDDVARLDIISEGNILWTPRITFTAGRFPHIKKAGSEINWGGQKFVLKGPER